MIRFPFFVHNQGLRFGLANDPSGVAIGMASSDPFVSLSEGGMTARVLLADVSVGGGTPLLQVAVKLRRNGYRVPLLAGHRSQLTNRLIDEQWEAERRALLRGTDQIGTLHTGFREWAEHGLFAPILYCARSGQYFHPPSPFSGKPLTVCRDDMLLQSVGLRPYSESVTRYLYCPVQAESQKADPYGVTLWSHSATPEEPASPRVKIRRAEDLFADIWPVIEAVAAGTSDAITREALTSCFPAGFDAAAVQRESMIAVSFYETELLPLALRELNFDEACVLLGGAGGDAIGSGGMGGGLPARHQLLKTVEQRLTGPTQFFFSDDSTGLFPLECLVLKLGLVRECCELVERLHAEYQRPHLDLKPSHLLIAVGPARTAIPLRWTMQPALIDLGATAPLAAASGDPASTIFRPPLEPDAIYSAPFMREEGFGKSELAHLIIRTVESLPADGTRVAARLELDLMGQSLRARRMSARDVLIVSLPTSGGHGAVVQLTAEPREQIEGGVRCLATTGPIDKPLLGTLEAMTNRVIYDREVVYYRAFSVPCDVHSLGMLLLRALLVNDGQDTLAIAETVKYLVGKIELSLPRGEVAEPRRIDMLVREHIRGDNRTFNPFSVLHRRDHRAATRNAIPEDVWEDLLTLGFRMVTQLPGFSVCADSGDFEPDRMGAAVGRVRAELEAAQTRLWAELFGSQAMNRDVLSALDLIAESLASRPGGH